MRSTVSPGAVGRRGLLAGAGAAIGLAALPQASAAVPQAAAPAVDARTLARAVERARGLDQLHALVVGHGGAIVFAEAFRGPALDVPVNVKSVSKTVVAVLTGIAIDRGLIAGVDAPMAPLLGPLVPAAADPRVEDITVDHLLTMRTGLERTSGPNYGQWVGSANWVAYVLTGRSSTCRAGACSIRPAATTCCPPC
ncbi:MAG: serine hydrolase [Alphaproteobacteria bacterium]